MNGGRSEYRRDLWLPGLVGLLGVLISLAGWGLLVSDRRERLLDATRRTAAETRQAVELAFEEQLATLDGLADLWKRFGLGSEAEWTETVDQRVDWVAGLTTVAWVDLDQPHHRITGGTRRPAPGGELAIDVREARELGKGPHLVGPERDAAGAFVYRVLLPVETPGHQAGVLVAQFHVAPFLEAVLRARAGDYALSVHWNDDEIFSRGTPSRDPWQKWWHVEEEADLPFGAGWRLVQRPTPEFAAARLTPTPHYLLAAGILLAVVLALATHQLRIIVRQARFLAASNRALEQRGLELESKVAERTEDLQDAVRELETFNYSVSHDLRSPLSAILNLAAILEEDYRDRPLDAEGLGHLERIRRSASRASALLEDLLQLSRAGRAPLSLETVDMTALARETFAQVRTAEDDGDVEFHVDPLPRAAGDRALLGDVFANLFSNALKYSRGREKRRIDVRGRADDGECRYEVSDNGQGFDMRFVDKLFNLFERLHRPEDIEGTGIGLAMVARIVKRHGGHAWAEGVPDEGARFFFTLPRPDDAEGGGSGGEHS